MTESNDNKTPAGQQENEQDNTIDKGESVAPDASAAPVSASSTEKMSTSMPPDSHQGLSQPKPRRAWATWLLSIVVLLLATALVGLAHYGKQLFEQQESMIANLSDEVKRKADSANASMAKDRKSHSDRVNALHSELRAARQEINDMGQRLTSQAKRLRAMSDTSREDWQLAEAEYLLKLANQRVQIERNAGGAEALIQEADNILRDLEDPDLHPLRRALARDLAALRLMNKVDVEGIYLALVALAEQVESLPLQSVYKVDTPTDALTDINLNEETELSAKTKFSASWQRFKESIAGAYRVIPKNELPKRVLPPDARHYVRQNLRLILERAQLALLREQQSIYQQSLSQAQAWINTHYNLTLPVVRFHDELTTLKEKEIVLTFPDISGSLTLLHEYIDAMHKLKDIKVSPASDRQPAANDAGANP